MLLRSHACSIAGRLGQWKLRGKSPKPYQHAKWPSQWPSRDQEALERSASVLSHYTKTYILDNKSTTNILDVTLRIPPSPYILSLGICQYAVIDMAEMRNPPHRYRSFLGIDNFQPPSKRRLAGSIMFRQCWVQNPSASSTRPTWDVHQSTYPLRSIHSRVHLHPPPGPDCFPPRRKNGGDLLLGAEAPGPVQGWLAHLRRVVRWRAPAGIA